MDVPVRVAGILPGLGSGSGSSLPLPVLLFAGISTITATSITTNGCTNHAHGPNLRNIVFHIIILLEAAFFIDVVRDIYEAFVIYCFFDLLIAYLGGERSLLILLHGRPPKYPVFPGNIFWREVDVSDPHTFLFLKRGVIQYVQVKPILALVTVILKLVGKFNEGDLRPDSGYLYVSIVYNASICLSLYCLAIFWMALMTTSNPSESQTNAKFLCVKGILFFSFWQSIFISILVAGGAIKKLGPYTDNEHISLGLIDTLICLEMPFFAIAHMYAFSTRDFVDPHTAYVARMPMLYAFRDAFGLKDVVEDTKATLRGEGMDYREFEPSEGQIHQGAGRDRRIRAGLRYSQGGKRKYWLPQHTQSTRPPGSMDSRMNRAAERITGRDQVEDVYAPLLSDQAEDVVHTAADLRIPYDGGFNLFANEPITEDGYELPFGDLDDMDEELFEHSKKYVFGDYNYPCVDISSEVARKTMWNEEERILRDERGAYFSPILGPARVLGRSREGYGAVGNFQRGALRERHDSNVSDSSQNKGKTREESRTPIREIVIDKEQDRIPDASMGERTAADETWVVFSPDIVIFEHVLPHDAVDLVVEDRHAAEEEMTRERRKGEPAVRGAGLHRVYRRGYVVEGEDGQKETEGEVEEEAGDPHSPSHRQQDVFGVGDDLDEIIDMEEQAVEEATVARGETLPMHVRMVVDHIQVPSQENPWA
ncbi:hypothetical protein A0H81_01686 [Grifola frondosa]|uniref:DUF300-domain-containing protein n=1 Tax=Grifola frondosa TaxID=5627 RepID=A0A1C7MNA3_GRIFR|nr:hypothetical protein A0H81_01686 [Grifola frondosa]